MVKTVEMMLKSVGLNTATVVSTVEEDEDHKLTVTISFLTVLLICLLLLSRVSVVDTSSVVLVVPSCCVAGDSSYDVDTSSWALGLVVMSICLSVAGEGVWTS